MPDGDKTIYYGNGEDADTLFIQVAFESKEDAVRFYNAISLWPYEVPLLQINGLVEISRDFKEITVSANSLRCVMFSDYNVDASESPQQTLTIPSASSMSAVVPVAERGVMLRYQSIEDPRLFAYLVPYECHIKVRSICKVLSYIGFTSQDKSKFPELRNNKSNVIAGSWTPFHQLFDGFMIQDGVGIPVMWFRNIPDYEPTRLADVEDRWKVEFDVVFRNAAAEAEMKNRFKPGTIRIGDLGWRTFVFVKEPDVLIDAIQWKCNQVEQKWAEFDES